MQPPFFFSLCVYDLRRPRGPLIGLTFTAYIVVGRFFGSSTGAFIRQPSSSSPPLYFTSLLHLFLFLVSNLMSCTQPAPYPLFLRFECLSCEKKIYAFARAVAGAEGDDSNAVDGSHLDGLVGSNGERRGFCVRLRLRGLRALEGILFMNFARSGNA